MERQETRLEPWKPDHYLANSGASVKLCNSRIIPAESRGAYGKLAIATTDIINNMIKSAKD